MAHLGSKAEGVFPPNNQMDHTSLENYKEDGLKMGHLGWFLKTKLIQFRLFPPIYRICILFHLSVREKKRLIFELRKYLSF